MSDSSDAKTVDELKTEIVGLKIRIKRVEDFMRNFPTPELYLDSEDGMSDEELVARAVKAMKEDGMVSASLFQRRFSIGYARAARLIDLLEEQGLISPADGSKPRKVLIKPSKDE